MRTLISKSLLAFSPPLRSAVRSTRFVPPVSATRDMSSGSTQRVFQLKTDPLTGNSEWVVIHEDDDELPQSSKEPLLATTAYLDMLNDSPRNRAFRLAIERTVTKPCHVLDIGAGTGLLSMMAARAMGSGDFKAGRVTACESYLPMVKLMKKVLRKNGIGRNIFVINKRSDELIMGVDIPSRAEVLVSEILDSELLGEGLIPTLQHAHDALLVKNPLTVPYRATTYGQLVESQYLRKLHDLYGSESGALDGVRLVPPGLGAILGVESKQFPMHCDAIIEEIKLLSEPFKLFEFDFWKRPDNHGETKKQIKAINDGSIHAVISWWTLQLDPEGTIFYSTAPQWVESSTTTGSREWCDHWKQCVWFIPGVGIPVSNGEEVMLAAVHTNISVSYNVKSQGLKNEMRDQNKGVRDFQLMMPPEKVAMYGDSKWRLSWSEAVKTALQGRENPLCMVVDDSIYLTLLLANLSETSHVKSLFPGLGALGAQYVKTIAIANGFTTDRFDILGRRGACLTMNDTHQKKVDVLVCEPYYYGNDGVLPWKNLRFWKERTLMEHLLSEDASVMPCKGILKACAMSLPDLWRSRCSLCEIEGFDHSIVNTTLGACGELPETVEVPCLPFSVWQCGQIKELSGAVTILEFDFSKPISSCSGEGQVEFTESGTCHGFVLWIDWVLDADHSIVVSTGPVNRFYKQGVKLLRQAVAVGGPKSKGGCEFGSAVIKAKFNPVGCEISMEHAFS